MKTKIEIPKIGNTIPAVGQPWRHVSDDEVFVRIDDEQGARALMHSNCEKSHRFYSVDLNTGKVAHTLIDSGDIQLLKLRDETFIPA